VAAFASPLRSEAKAGLPNPRQKDKLKREGAEKMVRLLRLPKASLRAEFSGCSNGCAGAGAQSFTCESFSHSSWKTYLAPR
jgi:hypothetical protein